MTAPAQIWILDKEIRHLRLERRRTESRRVRLDLEEVKSPRQLVLANEVNLVLALPVPPTADSRIPPLLQKPRPEIPFEGVPGKRVKVAVDDCADSRMLYSDLQLTNSRLPYERLPYSRL